MVRVLNIFSCLAHGTLVVVALSGPGGASLRTFDIQSGDLIAERRQHVPSSGLLFHPSDLGAHIVFADQKDATDTYVLTNGHVIRRVDSLSGHAKWEWSAPEKVYVLLHVALLARIEQFLDQVSYTLGLLALPVLSTSLA